MINLNLQSKQLNSIIEIDQEIMNGKPIFKGTRVPVSIVLEYLSLGWDLNDIKESFPSLSKRYVSRFIKYLSQEFKMNEKAPKK